MSFEWQDRDRAAETLGVSPERLQEWIESGHAPSRTQNGRVQVLIEHLEESEEESGESRDADPVEGDPFTVPAEESGRAAPQGGYPLDVVSKRELQLAGGMVHAWQRLAETSEQTLRRSRRAGVLAWSIVAILALSGGVGLWWSTREVTTAEARIALAEYDLDQVSRKAAEDREQLAGLRMQVDRLTEELSTVMEDFLQVSERASQAEMSRETLTERLRSADELVRERREAQSALVSALERTIAEQQDRIEGLEDTLRRGELETAEILARVRESESRRAGEEQSVAEITRFELTPLRDQLDEAQKKQTSTEREISEMKMRLEALTSQLGSLRAPPEELPEQ